MEFDLEDIRLVSDALKNQLLMTSINHFAILRESRLIMAQYKRKLEKCVDKMCKEIANEMHYRRETENWLNDQIKMDKVRILCGDPVFNNPTGMLFVGEIDGGSDSEDDN